MEASEILKRYKVECNTDGYDSIHEQYRKELKELEDKYRVKDKLSKPLGWLAVVLAAFMIVCIVADLPIVFYIILLIFLITLGVRAIYKKVVYSKTSKIFKSRDFFEEKFEFDWHYYENLGSVIGFYKGGNFCCGDYDEDLERAYCSYTGEPIDYLKYCNCHKKYGFSRCPYSKDYYSNLYDN